MQYVIVHPHYFNMLTTVLYEQLITKMISERLNALDKEKFYIKETLLDKAEAAWFKG